MRGNAISADTVVRGVPSMADRPSKLFRKTETVRIDFSRCTLGLVPRPDRSNRARRMLIRICLVAALCASCAPTLPRSAAHSPLPPVGRGTTVSPCAQRSGDAPRSSSRIVERREALVESAWFAYLASDSLPINWPAAAPYFSRVLAASWLKDFAAADSLTLVRQPAPPERTGTVDFLCAWQASELVSSFALGAATATGSQLQTHALAGVFAHARHSDRDSVYTSGDSAVSEAQLSAVRDTLLLVESILGARAVRPAFAHISSTDAMHAAALPVRPPGTVIRGYTVSPIGLPGISIAAPGPGRYSTLAHELAHLALAGAKDPLRGKLVGELAEEALARAIDGRARSSPGLLTEATVLRVLGTPALRHARIENLDIRSSDTEALVDVLGAIYRVSLLRCPVFPLRLLMPPAAESLNAAVEALGEQLGQSPSEVEATVISALATGPILGHDLRMRRLGCR
jgi:hypothetical protein